MKPSNLTFHWMGYSAKVDETAGEVVIDTSPLMRELHPGMMQQGEVKPVRGLANRFSQIETIEDVNEFAGEYGLLGLVAEQPHDSAAKYFPGLSPKYSEIARIPKSEPVSLWFGYAELMRRLLRVYYILDRGKRDPSYDTEGSLLEILSLEPRRNIVTYSTTEGGKTTRGARIESVPFCNVVWVTDGKLTGGIVEEETSLLDAAACALASITGTMLQGGIHLEYRDVVEAKDARLGYRISETRCTYWPLAAAFYDLWEMVIEDRAVTTCGFCGRVIEKSGRREYCNDAHKQAAYRLRQEKNKGRI